MQLTCQLSSSARIAVVGAGPGGLATAARLALAGRSVAIHDRSAERLAAIRERGGVELEGDLGEQLVALPHVCDSLDEAVAGARVVIVAVAADSHLELFERLLPQLARPSILLLLSGAAGTLEAARMLGRTDEVLLAESEKHPQSSRLTGPARVRVRFPSAMRVAAFPAVRTPELVAALGSLLPMRPTANVLDPALNNPNFMIHPAPMVTNLGDVERTGGTLSLMNEGMTAGTLRALDAVDAEKQALQRALGLEVVPLDELYAQAGSGAGVYRRAGEPFQTRDRIWDRYIDEDVPYGSVLYSTLGRLLGVPTPVCDGVTAVLSAATGVDLQAAGRDAARLGIEGMDRGALLRYLESG